MLQEYCLRVREHDTQFPSLFGEVQCRSDFPLLFTIHTTYNYLNPWNWQQICGETFQKWFLTFFGLWFRLIRVIASAKESGYTKVPRFNYSFFIVLNSLLHNRNMCWLFCQTNQDAKNCWLVILKGISTDIYNIIKLTSKSFEGNNYILKIEIMRKGMSKKS